MTESGNPLIEQANELALRGDTAAAFATLQRLPLEVLGQLLLEVPAKLTALSQLLPSMPSEQVQRDWTGNSGAGLMVQSHAFVQSLKSGFVRYTGRPLNGATILDYGCGWGRLLRLMCAFSPPERIYGVDAREDSIAICRDCKVLGNLAVCDRLPKTLPFGDVDFDLIFAFSVFTHLSERTAEQVQSAMRCRIKGSGLVALTVRPLEYWLRHREVLPPGQSIEGLMHAHRNYGFAFAPHNWSAIDGDVPYGDASISTDYIAQRWAGWKVVGTDVNDVDPNQLIVFLKPIPGRVD